MSQGTASVLGWAPPDIQIEGLQIQLRQTSVGWCAVSSDHRDVFFAAKSLETLERELPGKVRELLAREDTA